MISTEHDPIKPPTLPPKPATIVCVSSYFKGNDFLKECKEQGWNVVLLTLESLLGQPWARSHIDEVFGMPALTERQNVVNAVSYLARTRNIERVAPLDDYDVELAAHLREHLRIPGMGETTARYFRDKLAMRARAKDRNIAIPDFVHALNDDRVRHFLHSVPGPWLLKPRADAGSIGIKKVERAQDALDMIEKLGMCIDVTDPVLLGASQWVHVKQVLAGMDRPDGRILQWAQRAPTQAVHHMVLNRWMQAVEPSAHFRAPGRCRPPSRQPVRCAPPR